MSVKASTVVQRIDDALDAEKREKARMYIGASGIGNTCDALQAFSLRGFPNREPDARLKRIFQLGHILEDEVVKDLKRADFSVYEKDGLTGKQHAYYEWGGHISCHTDGLIDIGDDNLRILEIKSMNDSSHQKFKKSGVKISHPQYFAQLQTMMAMSNIHSSFFIAINKNTSSYAAEIIDFDEFEWAALKHRIETVLHGNAAKIATDESDWRCRGCFKADVCWHDAEVEVRCSTCAFANPKEDGGWQCGKHEREAFEVCEDYEIYKPKNRELI